MGLFNRKKSAARAPSAAPRTQTRALREELFAPMPPVNAVAPPNTPAITADKFVKQAPTLVDAYQQAGVSLRKKSTTGLRAAVYLVIDRSGSMTRFFGDNTVQAFAERVLAAAAHFDDDGTVPIFFFDSVAHDAEEITLGQHTGRVAEIHGRLGGMGSTNFADAMIAVIEDYRGLEVDVPAYVIFQTDGAPNEPELTEKIIRCASGLPIFWQFVGFGRDQFAFLKNLDTMTGRVVDNAGFFEAGADPTAMSDEELYDNMLGEFPAWTHAARAANILN